MRWPALSITPGGSWNRILLASMPIRRSTSPYISSSSSHVGSATASLLKRAIHSPRARANARLLARQKPVLFGRKTACALGSHFVQEPMTSLLPSLDPLSTSMNSRSSQVCLASEARQSSRNFKPFQLTTTMLTSGPWVRLFVIANSDCCSSHPSRGRRVSASSPAKPQPKTWRFFAPSCLRGGFWGRPYHEGAKNHEIFYPESILTCV